MKDNGRPTGQTVYCLKRRFTHIVSCGACLILLWSHCPSARAEEDQEETKKLNEIIWLCQHENYDEALAPLQALRKEHPQSSTIAYYLGMTLKKLERYAEARPHLEAAATLAPRMDNAIPELIDLLYKLDETDEAKRWIAVAEEGGISPPQTAFLKGLVCLKADDVDGAVAAFDRAKSLDGSLTETANYYKALAYLQGKRLSEAKEVFKNVVINQPTTDLATFANEYMDTISRVEESTKPFHAYVQSSLQYDDNVVLMPNDQEAVAGISDQTDWRQVYILQGDYNIPCGDKISLKPGYAFYYAKQFDLGFYDMMSHDVSLIPGAYFDKLAVTFPTRYDYITVNDKGYLSVVGISNLDNYMITKTDMAQCSFQYNRKIYLWQPNPAEENKTSNEYTGTLGWYHFFAKGKGVFAVAYSVIYDDTQGNNWRFLGNRATMTSTVPVCKRVKWSIALDYLYQDFPKTNSVYEKYRYDNVATVSNLVALEVLKDIEVQLQHSYVNDASSLGIYKYQRNVFGAGVKCKF